MSEAVLRVEGLTKRYGDFVAVDGLTLEVNEGEVFGLLGPNGAGKTTSIQMMCGLLEPTAGRVLVRGKPMAGGDAETRARVGVCPQEIVLWERLTCIEQLEFIGQMYGLPGKTARATGDRLLDELGLADKRGAQARTLSGGMQRRLNLAMALVHDPEIVVLDEPEAGLDPQSRVKVREYVQKLAHKKTVLLTTHNMDEADRLADRVAIVDHGKLLVLDTPDALKRRAGEGDVLELRLPESAGDGAAAKEAAARAGFPGGLFEAGGRTLTVRAPNAVASLPGLLDGLAAIGARPEDVRLRAATLEDVFIELTGRGLRE